MSDFKELDEVDAFMDEMQGATGGGGSYNATAVEMPQKRKDPPTSGNAKPSKQSKLQEKKASENRAVFVTNIPRNATTEEIHEVFKRYGIIDQGVDGNPRIKMYADDNGDFNGEALIVFFKKDSVGLAIDMQDDFEFRFGDRSNGTLTVEAAQLHYKKYADKETVSCKMVRKDRKTAERNRAELNRKLAEWSDNEEQVKETYAPKKNKWAKIAIIKKVFELHQLESDDDAMLEIKDDMRKAGEVFGEVTKVTLYDKEPEGIVCVRFKDSDDAEAFQKSKYNGRGYNNQPLQITIAEDRPKFKKSKGNGSDSEDDVQRMERFLNEDAFDGL